MGWRYVYEPYVPVAVLRPKSPPWVGRRATRHPR